MVVEVTDRGGDVEAVSCGEGGDDPGGVGAHLQRFVLDEGLGVTLPAGHHRLDVADGKLDQGGDQFRLVFGEQRECVG